MYIIDRFEGDWAIVETENRNTFNLPRMLLPADAREGDAINVRVEVDPVATKERTGRSKQLIENFFDE